jgi:hypothetical protein
MISHDKVNAKETLERLIPREMKQVLAVVIMEDGNVECHWSTMPPADLILMEKVLNRNINHTLDQLEKNKKDPAIS